MPNYIGKLLMNFGKYGASETYAIQKSDIAAALIALNSILDQRRAMLFSDVTIVGGVVSDTDIRGDSLISTTPPIAGNYAELSTATYSPYASLLYRLTDPTHVHRSLKYVRFIPNENFDGSGAYQPVLAYLTALTTFYGILSANCAIPSKIKTAVAPPFYHFYTIDTVKEERVTNKKVGRPFLLSVGRRPT